MAASSSSTSFSSKKINGYAGVMVEYAERMLATWIWSDRKTRDIHVEMMRLTFEIVMKTIFNAEVDKGEAETIAHALDVAMH